MPHTRTKRALEVLRAVNKALETATEERQLLHDVCRIAVEVGGYRLSWAGYAQHDAGKSVRFMAHAGYHPDYLKKIRITWDERDTGQGPAGIAIRTLTPTIIQHITESQEFSPWRENATAYGYQSVIALPLDWRGSPFGCLAILSAEPDAFDDEEADLLGELAASLSYGIHALRTQEEHERLTAELRNERDSQEALRRILNLSLENISLEEKLNKSLELLFDIPWLTLERKGSVFLVDQQNQSLRLIAKRHLTPVLHTLCAEVPFGRCLCGKAAQSEELVFHSHMDESHETRFDGIQDHGHYCQPIHSDKGLIGVLNLYVAAGHQSTSREVRFLSAVADTLAGIIEREHSESSRQRLVTLLEATPDLVAITDTEGHCLYCNDTAQKLLGIDPDCRNCDKTIFNHFPERVAEQIHDVAYPMAMEAGLWEGELSLLNEQGRELPVSLLIMCHRDSQGNIAYLSTTARDISDRFKAEQAAQTAALREKNFANTLINSLPGIFYLTNAKGQLIRWNSNLETTLGYNAAQLANNELASLIAEDSRSELENTCDTIIKQGSASVELDFVDSEGQSIPFYITGTLIEHSDTGRAVVGIGIDISYRKKLEQELQQRATTDPLTGASNRLKMEESLEHELNRSERYHSPLSIAMFDIDHFKKVNDTFGHDVGDDVLKAVAGIAKEQLREVDILSRWGGEEFMIISAETTLEQMHKLTERIRLAIENYHGVDGVKVTASFGIGEFQHGETQKQLLKRVDDALYLAKASGRNQLKVAS